MFAYTVKITSNARMFMTPTEKKTFDHLNSLLAEYETIIKHAQIMKLMKKQSM